MEDEKQVESKFASFLWIYTEEVPTRGQVRNLEMEEYLKRLMSIVLCNLCWFDVTSGPNYQHGQEVMGTQLDCKPFLFKFLFDFAEEERSWQLFFVFLFSSEDGRCPVDGNGPRAF